MIFRASVACKNYPCSINQIAPPHGIMVMNCDCIYK
eukprot:UN00762